MADMYRCMLNKEREAPRCALVPLREYRGAMTKYAPRRPALPPAADPSAGFVLFHRDLADAARCRGVLEGSSAIDMWGVVARHSEPWPDDADDGEADKTADHK